MAQVLATEDAFTAATNIKNTLDNGLTTTLGDLKTHGAVLCDPTKWQGQTASTFRDGWQNTTVRHLDTLLTDLQALQVQIQQVLTNIQDAGGGLR
jgi:uncharacterized protein YukE